MAPEPTKTHSRIAAFALIGFAGVIGLSLCGREKSSPLAPRRARIGERTKIYRKHFQGCETRAAQERLGELAAQGDEVAFNRHLSSLYESGACVRLRSDDEVYLLDVTLSGLAKIRMAGDTKEYWTNVEAIEP